MRDQESNRQRTIATFFLVAFGACAIVMGTILYQQINKVEEVEQQARTVNEQIKQEYQQEFLEIDRNLNEILAHEDMVENTVLSKNALTKDEMRKRIQDEIRLIDQLLAENEVLIEDLNSKIGEDNVKFQRYEKKISSLNSRLDKYRDQVNDLVQMNEDLSADLEASAFDNEQLQGSLRTKDMEIAAKIEELEKSHALIHEQKELLGDLKRTVSAAYYTVGTYKELKEANVVEKTGGIIGIGATKQLKDDFNKSPFARIDKNEYTVIPVYSKKAELVTNHNPDSYEWVADEKGVQWLEIKNPAEFWQQSRFLVIVTKEDKDFDLALSK